MPLPLRAVLLDIDGTLVNSNDAHAQAWVDAFSEFGHSVAFEQARRLIGKGGDKLLPETIGVEKETEHGKRLEARRSQIFQQRYLPGLRPFPGARELLERLHGQGLRLVVATSAKEEEMDALLDICGAKPYIFARTSSDDAEKSKPDGDIIAAALKRAKAEPHQALMLGDTPYDIEAAARMHVGAVALRCGGWGDAALAGALAIYADPGDLLERYAESPFAMTA